MKIPWISKERIAQEAGNLLGGYAAMVGKSIHPPIPVEDIIERFLGLNLSYEDLEEKLGIDDVLGATYVNSRSICVNEKLLDDPDEGRILFTCAHEVGHWVLHRHLVKTAARSAGTVEAVVCRARNVRQPMEWQANHFAGCLLMPEHDVKRAFSLVFQAERVVLDNVKSALGGTGVCVDPCVENWPLIADAVRESGGFSNVSKEAMIFRVEDLGLLVNRTEERVGWKASSKE